MIKQGIKNYFANIKYIFVPLGMIALGFVIGLSAFIPGVINAISDLTERIIEISGDTTLDFEAFKGDLFSAVGALNWSDPIGAIKQVFNVEWLTNTFNTCISALLGNAPENIAQIGECINLCIADISSLVRYVIAFTILGFIGGYYLTKKIVRRNIAKRALWKFFFITLVDAIINATIVSLCLWLLSIWKPSVFISSALSLILYGFIALFEAYLVHGYKKTDIKKIVNFKNLGKLFLSTLIIFLLSLIIMVIVVVLFNQLVGIFVGVALVAIAFIVISMNAESYVISVVKKQSAQATEEIDSSCLEIEELPALHDEFSADSEPAIEAEELAIEQESDTQNDAEAVNACVENMEKQNVLPESPKNL